MSVTSYFKNLENKYPWSISGIILAVIFGLLSVYLGFYKKDKPDLKFIIVSDSSVFDIKENVGNLDVTYKNESLSKINKDLRLIVFKIINQGNSPILQNSYDINDPIGFEILDGKIASEPIITETSNNYLKEKLLPEKRNESIVIFPNVIIEPQDFIEIKLIILHEIGKKPYIKPIGKIALLKSIDVIPSSSEGDSKSFLENLFGGGFIINIFRFVVFGILFLFLFILIAIIIDKILSIIRTCKRKKLLNTFKEYESDKVTEKDNFFFDNYIKRGAHVIEAYYHILGSNETLTEFRNEFKGKEIRNEIVPHQNIKGKYFYCNELLKEGFISIDNENIEIDQQRFALLSNFVAFLKRKGELKEQLKKENPTNNDDSNNDSEFAVSA